MDKSGPRLRVSRAKQKILLNLLRDVRESRAFRQEDVAEALGWPQSAVSKYESGERRLDLIELHDVCTALGVPLGEFVKRFERGLRSEPSNEAVAKAKVRTPRER